VIQFSIFRYQLVPQESLNSVAGVAPRSGVLLRMRWPDHKIGYADLMPWPEFGDPKLEEHLEKLSKGHLTQLMEQSIWLGHLDAMARSKGIHILDGVPKMKNHYTITDISAISDSHLKSAKTGGFRTLKVKVGRDWTSEAKWLIPVMEQYPFKIRLDFNSTSDFSTFERMLTAIPAGLRRKIEYVEDPFRFDIETWTEAAKLAPLAVDFEYANVPWSDIGGELPFAYLVLKPARQDVDQVMRKIVRYGLKVSVSSSMDHTVGVVHALAIAGQLKSHIGSQLVESGCLTTRLYRGDPFSSRLMQQGPFLTKPEGTGIGFDDLFAALDWEEFPLLTRAK